MSGYRKEVDPSGQGGYLKPRAALWVSPGPWQSLVQMDPDGKGDEKGRVRGHLGSCLQCAESDLASH